VPATIFAGSKVKALKDRLSLNDTTEIISVNADPSSGAGVAAPLGSLAMDYLAGKVYKKTGSLATEWQELGAGLGGINYIENPDAESGTAGWATYADAAGSQPVDGTGGTANITWSRSTTSPLRGVADFNLVKDAVNRQGQGVSYDFTIDPADQAKILTISFDYEVLSGTYATGDLAVYIIQDPAGTPVVLQPAGFQVEAATVGNKVREVCTFQTASNVTSYRLCIHVASTSASAYSLAIDNVSVSPQQVVYGAPVTDWQSYTPTITGFGTPTNVNFRSRRVGDTLEVQGYFQSGTNTSVTAQVSLGYGGSNSNVTIDTTKMTTYAVVGTVGYNGQSSTYFGSYVVATGANSYLNFSAQTSTTNNQSLVLGTFFTNSAYIQFIAKVPILGWSSSVVVSSSTDTRVVSFSGTQSSQAVTANVTNLTLTAAKDSHGAWATNIYTVAVPGDYMISGSAISSVGNQTIQVYKNGAAGPYLGTTQSGAASVCGGSAFLPNLSAGDTVAIRFTASSTITSGNFSIHRLSGPSQIAASETVAARVYNTSGFSVPNASVAVITGWTKTFDTHGAFNATTGVFTVPVAGKYRVSGMLLFSSAAYSVTNPFSLIAQQAGSVSSNWVLGETWPAANNTSNMSVGGSDTIQCNAGDTISVAAYQAQGGARTLGGAATENHFDIQRIGN
jgi:hypothetical protein